MGLIKDYETINSEVYYFMNFELNGQIFRLNHGIENPEIALELFRDLKKKEYFS